MAVFVMIHGGFDGGWAWSGVAGKLRSAKHHVTTPTLTGSGERVHLRTAEVSLHTHIIDIVNVIEYEDLWDVILVGHSNGGAVAVGVVQRIPERIRHVVYLDALVPRDGESIFDLLGPELTSWIEKTATESGDGWRLPHSPPTADRRTDVLLRPLRNRIKVERNDYDCTYIAFTNQTEDDPFAPVLRKVADRYRAKDRCNYREVPLCHFPLLDASESVAQLLMDVVSTAKTWEAH